MSYLLSSTVIRRPNAATESNSTQFAQQRTLLGTIARDFFGSNKRIWVLEYNNLNTADYATINTIYQAYLASGNPVSWQVSEVNYVVNTTTVHVDLFDRKFSIPGTTYISDAVLTLTEA